MPYAIRRVFDGKLLPLPNINRRRGMTWCEFDDDIFLQNKHMIPALWPTKAGATSTMKMWCKGGWRSDRKGSLECSPQPDRDKFPVEVVRVEIAVVDEPLNEQQQQLPDDKPNPKSVL